MSLGIQTHLTGRLAAAVWAATALAGAVVTIGPLEIPGSDVSQMRQIAGSAGFFAGISFVMPWERMPKFAFHLLLVLMSAHIAGLAYASGAAHSELSLIFTFVVALAACFLPVKASVAQLCLIAIMLTVLLLIVGRTDDNRLEVIRVTMLLATLVVLCGLVLVMRALLAEDELGMRLRGAHRYGAGMLTESHLMAAISAELSRAARHARPLGLVMIEVTGAVADQAEPDQVDRLATNVSRAILGRIRVEDSAAHLGGLRYAVMAPETMSTGAAAVAGTVSDTVRKRLITAGYEGGSFDVAVGWADYPHNAASPEELMAAATASLEQETGRAAFGDAAGPHTSPSPAPGT
jgi:diguanylate cyclase (GGDEF)-like protein